MWVLSLYLCALVDGMLSGHRDGLGRNPLYRKGKFYARALLHGVILVHVPLLVVAIMAAVSLWCADQPGEPGAAAVLDAAARCARVTILVYGGYAAVIGLGLFSYILPMFELRSYITIGLFGVLTITRPLVIAAGAFAGLHAMDDAQALLYVAPVVLVAALLMMPLDAVHHRLGWNRFDWDELMSTT